MADASTYDKRLLRSICMTNASIFMHDEHLSPILSMAKFSRQDKKNDAAIVNCEYNVAPFSGSERKKRRPVRGESVGGHAMSCCDVPGK